MLLNEFPDLSWLKHQVQTRFENRRRWDGKPLQHPGWPNVILQVKAKEVYRNNITGPFSLFGNLSGSSLVTVENRRVIVDQDHFFISNAGQAYTLEVENGKPAETFNIHFGEYFNNHIIDGLTSQPGNVLDQGADAQSNPFTFYNHLIRKDHVTRQLINELQCSLDPMSEEENLVELFAVVFRNEQLLTHRRKSIPSIKKSTREEIMKRLLLSVDYVYTFYHRGIALDELAEASCLSKFHFLRLFKIAMGETPHQFITRVRLQKAKELLRTKADVATIAGLVGFENPSSFSRVFYNQLGVYPTQFHNLTT